MNLMASLAAIMLLPVVALNAWLIGHAIVAGRSAALPSRSALPMRRQLLLRNNPSSPPG